MKIAIISDIHGNMEALSAVLSDIKKEDCERIYCLGDVAMAGPEPKETIKKIQELLSSEKFEIIQGNTDKMLSVFSFEIYNKIAKLNAVMASAYLADSELLSEDDKNFLKSLPENKEIEISGIKILFVHGSPRRNDENIYPDLKIEQVEEMIAGCRQNVIFCGHTHMPCGYQTNTEQTIVNAGSVGRPFSEKPQACYAIMNINEENFSFEIKHKFVEYDVETASKKLCNRGFQGCEKLAEMLKKATSRYPV